MTEKQSDFLVESDFDTYDPLEDLGPDEDEFDEDTPLESGNVRGDAEGFPTIESLSEEAAQNLQAPPEVRTQTLFEQMHRQKKILRSVLELCQEPQTNEAVVGLIAELKQDNHSVYSPDNICLLLERAGAMERITEDGTSFENVVLEPERVIEDGVEYLVPAQQPELFWSTTDAGIAALENNQPAGKLESVLDEEPQYHTIYREILKACSREDGADQKTLSKKYHNQPVVESPHYYIERFINVLGETEAITWKSNAWHITDLGRQALEIIDSAKTDAQ